MTERTPAGEREVDAAAERLGQLREALRTRIVGQEDVVRQVTAAVLAEGHGLIVGLPGLAKTLLVSSIAELLSLEFKRIQFTPDLMPSDITGASIISEEAPGQRNYKFLEGPIFSNIILADEINRTPPKTQAALMEAMEERQVSAGGKRLVLERPFFVLATQNPIEQEGTYPLPVSQLDRFMLEITIDYPTTEEEFRIVVLTTSTYSSRLPRLFSREEVLGLVDLTRRIEVPADLLDYASRIVRSTRPSSSLASEFTKESVAWGGGPRAAQSMVALARAYALMAGRNRIEPDDLHAVAVPTLRHRILLRYHAQAEGVRAEEIVEKCLRSLPGSLYRPAPEEPVATKPGRFFGWPRKQTGIQTAGIARPASGGPRPSR